MTQSLYSVPFHSDDWKGFRTNFSHCIFGLPTLPEGPLFVCPILTAFSQDCFLKLGFSNYRKSDGALFLREILVAPKIEYMGFCGAQN